MTPMKYQWQIFANGMGHIRVDCQDCNTFIKWAKRTEVNMSRADVQLSITEGQLLEGLTVLNERPPLNRLR
jgi:hypothetical protein